MDKPSGGFVNTSSGSYLSKDNQFNYPSGGCVGGSMSQYERSLLAILNEIDLSLRTICSILGNIDAMNSRKTGEN